MDKDQADYYKKMYRKDRLMSFGDDGGIRCYITFYICNDPSIYIQRDNQWKYILDDVSGSICYIDHLITKKRPDNTKHTFEVWNLFKYYIADTFPNVTHLRWNRYKNKKLYIYYDKLREVESDVYNKSTE